MLDVARLCGVLQPVDGSSRVDGSVAVPLHGRSGSVGAGNVVEPGGLRAASVAGLGAALDAGGRAGPLPNHPGMDAEEGPLCCGSC